MQWVSPVYWREYKNSKYFHSCVVIKFYALILSLDLQLNIETGGRELSRICNAKSRFMQFGKNNLRTEQEVIFTRSHCLPETVQQHKGTVLGGNMLICLCVAVNTRPKPAASTGRRSTPLSRGQWAAGERSTYNNSDDPQVKTAFRMSSCVPYCHTYN